MARIQINSDESGVEIRSDTMMDLRQLTIILLKAATAVAERGGAGPRGSAEIPSDRRIVVPKIATGGAFKC